MSVLACENQIVSNSHGENAMEVSSIEAVLKEHTKELMSLPEVVGTGQGLCNNRPCIKVYVIKKTPELDQYIPNMLEGYKVMIEVTGKIQAHPKSQVEKK